MRVEDEKSGRVRYEARAATAVAAAAAENDDDDENGSGSAIAPPPPPKRPCPSTAPPQHQQQQQQPHPQPLALPPAPGTIDLEFIVQRTGDCYVLRGVDPRQKLGKLMVKLALQTGLSTDKYHALYEGSRAPEYRTPEDLGMKSGDAIDLVEERCGC